MCAFFEHSIDHEVPSLLWTISLLQSFTQSNGARPFGVSLLIVGFDENKTPKLYQTDPAGAYHEWKVHTHPRGVPTIVRRLHASIFASAQSGVECACTCVLYA